MLLYSQRTGNSLYSGATDLLTFQDHSMLKMYCANNRADDQIQGKRKAMTVPFSATRCWTNWPATRPTPSLWHSSNIFLWNFLAQTASHFQTLTRVFSLSRFAPHEIYNSRRRINPLTPNDL
jgi:hypothetical protein